MVTTSFLMAILFLGGWHFPGIPETGALCIVLKLVVMFIKVMIFILLYMLIRWTLPRFRFDQLMHLAWKVMIPLALINFVCVMVVKEMSWSLWWLLPLWGIILVGGAFLAVFFGPRRPSVVTVPKGGRFQAVTR